MKIEQIVEYPVQIVKKTEKIDFFETKVPTFTTHKVSVSQVTPQVLNLSAAPTPPEA